MTRERSTRVENMNDTSQPMLPRVAAPRPMQRVGALTGIPGLLEQFGISDATVLERAGLNCDVLAEREGRIPYERFGVLLQVCAEATRYPQFGLLAGRTWTISASSGMPCAIRTTSATRCKY